MLFMLIFTAVIQLLCQGSAAWKEKCRDGAAVPSFTPMRLKFDSALLVPNSVQEILQSPQSCWLLLTLISDFLS